MTLAGLWVVFSLSFVMSLSGAVMPGPLFTYTVARTLVTGRAGWLTGARVIAGHAALEGLLVCGLVLGVVSFLRAPAAVKVIGVVGGLLLLYVGFGLLREAIRGGGLALAGAGQAPVAPAGVAGRLPPVLAGVLLSMSNPYWWIWWVTVGSAFLLRFDISFARGGALLAFFLGHELGDLAWFTAVSTALHLGRRSFSRGLMTVILGACGVVIIGFALYLGITAFLKTA